MVIAPMESPEPRTGGDRDEVVLGTLCPHRHPGTGPEGKRVVRTLVCIRTALALTGATHVDDAGTVGADLLHPDLQLPADAREFVGEEHVGGRRQLVENLETVRRREVEGQALLPPIGVLHERVHVAGHCGDTR